MTTTPTSPLRLNLGSGNRAIAGWVCIDSSPNVWLSRAPRLKRALARIGVLNEGHLASWDLEVRRYDIRHLPFPDNSAEAVYSSHTLEHVYLEDARRVLKESARVLRPGGILRLALPNAEDLARRFVESVQKGDPEAGWRYNEGLLAHPYARARGVWRLIGATAGHIHRWQPTPTMVEKMLTEAGFTDLRRHEFQSGELPDVARIETRPESFFLEARKPR